LGFAVTILVAAPVAAIVPYAIPNVLGAKTANNRAAYASITTSDPTIRNAATLKWVYHRVLVRRIQAGYAGAYVESGWIKDAANGNYPRFYWTTRDINDTPSQGFYDAAGSPGIGGSYNYQVQRTGSKTWGAYVGATRVANKWIGWDTMWEWASGGEAPDTNQGMGDSNHNNVQILGTDGVWYSTCGYDVYNPNFNIWTLWGGANCSSWRIFGNN
jgi:hypothetical protein